MRVLLIIMSFCFLSSCNSKTERIQPQRMELTESVYASVTVQPDSLYKVHTTVSGILDELYVDEGDSVRNEQKLLKIVSTNSSLSSENAKLAYEQARNNYSGSSALLKSMEEDISTAKLKLANDSVNYFRQKNLWDQKIGSKAQYDNSKLAYELSRNTLSRLRNEFARTQQELRTLLEQAENQYQSSLVTQGDFTIRSKLNGTVYSVYKNPGELVNTLEPIATIGCSDKFIIELLVDEVDVVQIREGQQVILVLDAYGDKTFRAQISKILPEKDYRNQTFTVEARFLDVPARLYPGLSGEANVIIATKKNALVIPREYLIDKDRVLTESGQLEIETGLTNLQYVEVLSGITEEDWILKPER